MNQLRFLGRKATNFPNSIIEKIDIYNKKTKKKEMHNYFIILMDFYNEFL